MSHDTQPQVPSAGARTSGGKRNPRYDILFEPVKLGPVIAPNRFYQVPHASGMTNALPRVRAKFREIKAEGGWGVICTGACSIHPTSDDAPLPMARLWNDDDIRAHALMTDAVHRHGSLAGVELWHGGASVFNRASRLPPISPSGTPWMATHIGFMSNLRPRVMDEGDIRDLLRWQAEGAKKARSAGFDIVYVYAGMGYLPYEFMLPEYNQRTDAYGGSMENRSRLIRQLLEVTKDAVGQDCAVALRVSLEELRGRRSDHAESEGHEFVGLLADIPDLWDVKMDSSPTDCSASRFAPEGSHEPVIDFVKRMTTKPVVGVGRFTSPDTMVSQIKRGILDLIGGARPSIADPFLPNKIREGREDEIRECIGCNICISSWHDGVPVRCTQNPTAGEEWRRGWHPETMQPKKSDDHVLIVGGGPAGLECALSLGRRGYEVTIADQRTDWGGRLLFEAALPGLAAWKRVIDYRLGRLKVMPNVEMFLESPMLADDIINFGCQRIVLATGSTWTPELYSAMEIPVGRLDHPQVLTPDDLAAGRKANGPIVVFDFDNYYMGSCIAELLHEQGECDITYVTPAGHAAAWTIMSNELPRVHQAFARRSIKLRTLQRVVGFDGETVTLNDLFTNAPSQLACKTLVITGMRRPKDALYHQLMDRSGDLNSAGIRSVHRIGDAEAAGALTHAIHSAHRYARELDEMREGQPYKIDAPFVTVPA